MRPCSLSSRAQAVAKRLLSPVTMEMTGMSAVICGYQSGDASSAVALPKRASRAKISPVSSFLMMYLEKTSVRGDFIPLIRTDSLFDLTTPGLKANSIASWVLRHAAYFLRSQTSISPSPRLAQA